MYIVIEIQTYENGTVGTLVNQYANAMDAESKYHLILSAAAVSGLPHHSAIILDNDATPGQHKGYIHSKYEDETVVDE